MLYPLWLSPGAQVVRGASDQARVRRRAPSEPLELHVHRGGLGISFTLVVDEQLLHDARQKLYTRLLLMRTNQAGAADLVEHCRGTLIRRWIQRIVLQR